MTDPLMQVIVDLIKHVGQLKNAEADALKAAAVHDEHGDYTRAMASRHEAAVYAAKAEINRDLADLLSGAAPLGPGDVQQYDGDALGMAIGRARVAPAAPGIEGLRRYRALVDEIHQTALLQRERADDAIRQCQATTATGALPVVDLPQPDPLTASAAEAAGRADAAITQVMKSVQQPLAIPSQPEAPAPHQGQPEAGADAAGDRTAGPTRAAEFARYTGQRVVVDLRSGDKVQGVLEHVSNKDLTVDWGAPLPQVIPLGAVDQVRRAQDELVPAMAEPPGYPEVPVVGVSPAQAARLAEIAGQGPADRQPLAVMTRPGADELEATRVDEPVNEQDGADK